MVTTKELEARARIGMEWLDKNGPLDWRERIDLKTLDLSSPWKCVLGQVYGSFHVAPVYAQWSIEKIARAGFTFLSKEAPNDGDDDRVFAGLAQAWKKVLSDGQPQTKE